MTLLQSVLNECSFRLYIQAKKIKKKKRKEEKVVEEEKSEANTWGCVIVDHYVSNAHSNIKIPQTFYSDDGHGTCIGTLNLNAQLQSIFIMNECCY